MLIWTTYYRICYEFGQDFIRIISYIYNVTSNNLVRPLESHSVKPEDLVRRGEEY